MIYCKQFSFFHIFCISNSKYYSKVPIIICTQNFSLCFAQNQQIIEYLVINGGKINVQLKLYKYVTIFVNYYSSWYFQYFLTFFFCSSPFPLCFGLFLSIHLNVFFYYNLCHFPALIKRLKIIAFFTKNKNVCTKLDKIEIPRFDTKVWICFMTRIEYTGQIKALFNTLDFLGHKRKKKKNFQSKNR